MSKKIEFFLQNFSQRVFDTPARISFCSGLVVAESGVNMSGGDGEGQDWSIFCNFAVGPGI